MPKSGCLCGCFRGLGLIAAPCINTRTVEIDVQLHDCIAEKPARLLTVAGSDSSGGAGVQADLKTFAVLRGYGMSVLTAITAQNTNGVQSVATLSAEFVGEQLDSVLSDLGADVVKTGMLGTTEIVEITAAKIRQFGVKTVVVDPVMISTAGDILLEPDAIEAYKKKLIPLASIVTPNIKELEQMLGSGFRVKNLEDMKRGAVELHKLGPKTVLVKGGGKHAFDGGDSTMASDVLFDGETLHVLQAPRVMETRNLHGTGCTLASAIAAFLGQDPKRDVYTAVCNAKKFIICLVHRSKGISMGSGVQGPLHHALWDDGVRTLQGRRSIANGVE